MRRSNHSRWTPQAAKALKRLADQWPKQQREQDHKRRPYFDPRLAENTAAATLPTSQIEKGAPKPPGSSPHAACKQAYPSTFSAKPNHTHPTVGVFFLSHHFPQDLPCSQCAIRFCSGISPGNKDTLFPIDRYQAVGLVVPAIGEQHDVSPSQFFGRDRLHVKDFSILDRRLHASAARSKAKAESARKQGLGEDPEELRMCPVFRH